MEDQEMQRSTDRILTTHTGSLPMPVDLHAMLRAREAGQPYDAPALQTRLTRAVAEVVQQQAEHGLAILADGEQSKTSFTTSVSERLSGIETRPGAVARRQRPPAPRLPRLLRGTPPPVLGGASAIASGRCSTPARSCSRRTSPTCSLMELVAGEATHCHSGAPYGAHSSPHAACTWSSTRPSARETWRSITRPAYVWP